MTKKYKNFLLLIFSTTLFFACGKSYTPEQKEYISFIKKQREEKNQWMKNSPDSPFNFKGKIEFHELNYFDVNPDFVFYSKLIPYQNKDTITIFGTKGEPRKAIRYGYLTINFPSKSAPINVYESLSKNGQKYYSIWFTDLTTNKESYGVGRYIDFELNDDPNYFYKVDFNLSYNPYCAYSSAYSCAIPTKDDFIPIEIKAGEKKFHN